MEDVGQLVLDFNKYFYMYFYIDYFREFYAHKPRAIEYQ